jgi:cytochrome c5
MSEEQMNDSTFGRLFIVLILTMIVMAITIAVLAGFASNDVNTRLEERSEVENTAAIAARTAPVGEFSSAPTEGLTAPVAIEPVVLSGEEAYSSCSTCHAAGIAGAPLFADKAAWESRISQGIDTLYKHAIEGFQGSAGYMPAKGGNMALSDESVKAAVDYMVEAVK